jgi:hypothetical protein
MLIGSTPASRSCPVNTGSTFSAVAGVTNAVSRTGISAPLKPSPATSLPSSSPGSSAHGLVKTDQV